MRRLCDEDIIAAIATATGSGGIGIVRVSGDGAVTLVDGLFKSKSGQSLIDLGTHRLVYGNFVDGNTGHIIDEVLVSVMRAPATYTTQDVVEINCHGGRVPTQAVLTAVLEAGARLADPGEFTKRAFLGGRIDLTQAEAVMDIIGAKTKRALELSVGQLSGGLSHRMKAIDAKLLDLLSDMEANIDYPEYDVEDVSTQHAHDVIHECIENLTDLADSIETGKIMRDGLPTAIIGAPNVGKSSLLNRLIEEDKAIVTDIPGTTRDIIEEYVNISGVPFKIIDTAGIRQTDDVVEKIGVERSLKLIDDAALIIFLTDVSRETSEEEQALIDQLGTKPTIIVGNKMDLDVHPQFNVNTTYIPVSLRQMDGLDALKSAMVKAAVGDSLNHQEDAMIINVRQADLIKQARAQLVTAIQTLDSGIPQEMISIDIQDAIESIRAITGETMGTDLIDTIFSKFCLGK